MQPNTEREREIAQRVDAKVLAMPAMPGDTQDDDLPVEVPSFEQIFDRYETLHLFIIACHPSRLHQSHPAFP
jgi:hypothetical protein